MTAGNDNAETTAAMATIMEAMTLNPSVRALLDMIAASGRPKIWQVSPPEARAMVLALAKLVDAKDVPTGNVRDGTMPGPGGALRYRAYTPAAPAGAALPGLVYFHGGAWVFGDLDSHDGMCRLLANESGCLIIAVDYRLAPEHRFPAAVEDAFAATAYVAANASQFGIDASRLAVGGDSAGGNLAAVVCQQARKQGPRLALAVLFCPALDFSTESQSRRDFAEGYFLEQGLMRWAADHYVPPGENLSDPRLSPLHLVDLSGLPATHLHVAAFDPLRDEGAAYADALRGAGVKVRYACHDGMIHHFYAMADAIPYARTALKAAGEAIRADLA